MSGCIHQQEHTVPTVKNGILDLRGNCRLLNDQTITLQGKWAFYWNEFLLGSNLRNTAPDFYGQVPKAWNNYRLNGKTLPVTGYATYRLHVISDMPVGTIWGLQIPCFTSAYRLYINEKEIAKNGTVATNRQNEVGRLSPKVVYFTTPAKGFDIVIHVSNFEYATSGFWNIMYLGTAKNIQHEDELTYAKIFLTYGIELFVALFSLILYIKNRQLTHCLYFCLVCVFSVLTLDAVDHQILFQPIMKIHFQWFVYIKYSGFNWCIFFLLLLYDKVYPSKMSSGFVKTFLVICSLFQVIYTVTDPLFYTGSWFIHNVVSILGILFALIIAIYGLLKGQRENWINILCVVIFLVTYIHDTLLVCDVIYSQIGKITYFGMLLCMLLMMVMTTRLNQRYQERMEASELAFLQAQIKPHFIFNTINTLITLTYEDVEKTRMLMIKFSQYLRNSFDFTGTDHYIPFEKDMEYVTAFVEIEKVRFEGRFEIEYDIDDDIHANVPILILQPVIENAVVHGVLQNEKYGHIWVSIKKKGDQLAFCVRDDGVGFDQKQWERAGLIKPQKRIGLLNIDNRLKKLTKKGLTIKSEIGVGTQVSWNIPICKKENGKSQIKNVIKRKRFRDEEHAGSIAH